MSVPGASMLTWVMPQILRHGQALGEQVDDVAPGSLRVPWVVADAGDHRVADRRVVEGVQGATAVDREAPVDARGLHLSGERVPLCGRHDRVFRPDPTPAHSGQRMRADSPGRPVVSALTVPIARRLTPPRPSSSATAPPVP